MLKNMGGIDRVIRVVLGLAAVAAGLYFRNWWGAIGIVLLLTSAAGTCPLYLPFGLSTQPAVRSPRS